MQVCKKDSIVSSKEVKILDPSNGNQGSLYPIHNVEVKRWEKNGRLWFSHKAGEE